MAEAVCGPSNPLQSFQKHTSVDRTLQQDRTVLRKSPAQGFRTESSFAGSLDAEFKAFQTSQPFNAPQLPLQAPTNGPQLPLQAPHAPPFATSQQNLPSWATDFQRLHVSSPRPSVPSFQSRDASGPGTALNGWQKEFLAQHSQPQQGHHTLAQMSGINWQPQLQGQPYINDIMSFAPPTAQQQQPEHMSGQHLEFDETAFEQAFDAVSVAMDESKSKSKEKEKVEEALQPSFNMRFACTDPGDIMGEYEFDKHAPMLGVEAWNAHAGQEADLAEGGLGTHLPDQYEELTKIGSDTIPARSGLSPDVESDELARTAGELLDNLKDEQSSKFQQSNFLGLMRQLRDKQVRIEGDKMVSSTEAPQSEPSHPGGRYYPYDAFEEQPSTKKVVLPHDPFDEYYESWLEHVLSAIKSTPTLAELRDRVPIRHNVEPHYYESG